MVLVRLPRPISLSLIHICFDQLAENNNKRINTILSELQKKTYKAGTIEQKLSDFYKLSMDVDLSLIHILPFRK